MKKIIVFASLFSFVVFTGCASMSRDHYGAYLKSAEAMAKHSKPTFEISCPEGGCNFKRLAYNDPRDRVTIAQKAPHPVWKFFGTVVKGAVAFFGLKAVADVVETVATNSGDSIYTNSNNEIGGDNSYTPLDIATDIDTGDGGSIGNMAPWVGDGASDLGGGL